MRRRGVLAMTAVRLVPLAPFAVVNVVAGAIRMRLRHFMLGSALGILPGTLVATVFGDQLDRGLARSALDQPLAHRRAGRARGCARDGHVARAALAVRLQADPHGTRAARQDLTTRRPTAARRTASGRSRDRARCARAAAHRLVQHPSLRRHGWALRRASAWRTSSRAGLRHDRAAGSGQPPRPAQRFDAARVSRARPPACRPSPGATIIRHDREYGNALLTRRKILDVQRHDLELPAIRAARRARSGPRGRRARACACS